MGKHGDEYERVPGDAYPTPAWVTEALLEHVDITGMKLWEPACGAGQMVEVLKAGGAAQVYPTDLYSYTVPRERLDFLSEREPKFAYDGIITNPPYGKRGRLINPFIEAGLRRLKDRGGLLALLLAADCDSARRRPPYFGDCRYFDMKIVLTKRIVWFERSDGEPEAPKENHSWYIWRRPRRAGAPVILYAPTVTKIAA
jgi:hypothetical protein